MTEFEIRTLMYEEIQIAILEFEFWVTASFAVIVAGYYAFRHLEPSLQKTVRVLYLATAAVFIIRWFAAIYHLYEYHMALAKMGVDLGFQVFPGLATLIQTILMVFGTTAVLLFLKKMGAQNGSIDT